MTIEPAREVRQATSSETGWYAAGALLVAAGVATGVSVLRQWSLCDSTPPSAGMCDIAGHHEHAADPGRHDGTARAVVGDVGNHGIDACNSRVDRLLDLDPTGARHQDLRRGRDTFRC